jgi:membrane associated rhomboid family serine protease
MPQYPPDPATRQPVFNVPPGIVWLLGLLIAIHAVRALLSVDADNWLLGATAFIPARFSDPEAIALPGGSVASVTSWITHMLIHGSVLHLMFNAAWLLAFGGAVAQRIGSFRAIVFAAFCGSVGALTFLVVNWGELAPMVGASGAVMGLMGASMRFLFPALDRGRGSLRDIHHYLRTVPLLTLREALSDRRVQLTTGFLILLNLASMVGLGPGAAEGAIAWEAHLGGYVAGFLAYGLFDDAAQNHAHAPQPVSDDTNGHLGADKPTLH